MPRLWLLQNPLASAPVAPARGRTHLQEGGLVHLGVAEQEGEHGRGAGVLEGELVAGADHVAADVDLRSGGGGL